MKPAKIILLLLATTLLAACGTTRTVPITGRKQNIMVSDDQILSLSNQEYQSFMKTAVRSSNAANTAMVTRVGQRLAGAVNAYLTNHGMGADVNEFAWEFNLVQDKQVNAFCLPTGKIVVYEGLLPYTQTEAALAIVLGHEIAHAVAKHSAEQMSKQMRQQYGTQILGGVLNAAVGSGIGDIATLAAQTGFKFRNLKYSRDHEYEADRMGLIFAAMAGYDPQVAIPFWQRMAADSKNGNDFWSDHPSDAKRITALQKEMPEALAYYQAAGGKPVTAPKATAKPATSGKQTAASKSSASKSVSLEDLYNATTNKK